MSDEDRALLQTVARVIVCSTTVERWRSKPTAAGAPKSRSRILSRPPRAETVRRAEAPQRDLAFFNGLGGFSHDGREYVTITTPADATPAPWVNVIANPQFGTVVSRERQRLYLGENSHEFRLTPWDNDPVSRCQRRSDLSARRGDRAVLVPFAVAGARPDAVHRPTWIWLQHFRLLPKTA